MILARCGSGSALEKLESSSTLKCCIQQSEKLNAPASESGQLHPGAVERAAGRKCASQIAQVSRCSSSMADSRLFGWVRGRLHKNLSPH